MSLPAVSIIIPVYSARDSLPILVSRVRDVFSKLECKYEIVCVDDASTDGSWDVIARLSEEDERISGYRLPENAGQYCAVVVGLKLARYGYCITMDDDLQHPPEAIPELLAGMAPGVDVVYARPDATFFARQPFYHKKTYLMRSVLAMVCAAPHMKVFRSYRLIDRSGFDWSSLRVTRWHTTEAVLCRVRPRCRVISVPYGDRQFGHSHYNVFKQLRLAFYIAAMTWFPALENRLPEVRPVEKIEHGRSTPI